MEKDEEISFSLKLIENVKKKKCLYDKRDSFYFNKDVKEKAWKDVGKICSKSGSSCKHKWKLLRERFCKALKKMEAPSGSGMRYLEEWRFLQPMMFLKDYLAPRRTRTNVDEHDTKTVLDQAVLSGDSLLEPLSPYLKIRKKEKANMDSLCQKFDEAIKNIEMSLTGPTDKETTDEMFMKTVVSLMKDLPADEKDEFQAGIMQELYRLRRTCRNSHP